MLEDLLEKLFLADILRAGFKLGIARKPQTIVKTYMKPLN